MRCLGVSTPATVKITISVTTGVRLTGAALAVPGAVFVDADEATNKVRIGVELREGAKLAGLDERGERVSHGVSTP